MPTFNQAKAITIEYFNSCEDLDTWYFDVPSWVNATLSSDKMEGNYSFEFYASSEAMAYPILDDKPSMNWSSTYDVFAFWVKILSETPDFGVRFIVFNPNNDHYIFMGFDSHGSGIEKGIQVNGDEGEIGNWTGTIDANEWYWVEIQMQLDGDYIVRGNGEIWFSGNQGSIFDSDTFAFLSATSNYEESSLLRTDFWRFSNELEYPPTGGLGAWNTVQIWIKVDDHKPEFYARVKIYVVPGIPNYYYSGLPALLPDGTYTLDCVYSEIYNFSHWSYEGNIFIDDINVKSTTLTVNGDGELTLWLLDFNPYIWWFERTNAWIGIGSGLGMLFLPLLGAILVRREDDLWEKIKIIFICLIASLLLCALFISWLYP